MKRPLVTLALAFCLGIIFASQCVLSFCMVYCLCIIFLALSFLCLKKGLWFDIFILCLAFFLGLALLENSRILPKSNISKFIHYKTNSPYIVKGIIESLPQLKNNRACFILKTQELQTGKSNHRCCGNIIVYLKSGKVPSYGEELILKGNLYRPFVNKNQGQTSYRDYLYKQGIFCIMNVKTDNHIFCLNKNKGLAIKGLALWLKNKMELILYKRTSLVTASILDAMIMGEKRGVPPFVTDMMMKSGTVHILVVSGFNVGIVAFIIILLLKLLRLPKNLRFCIAIPCLIVYCLMTGASNPVVRATVMAIVFLLGFLVKREPDIYNSCAVALIFILMVNPRQLFDIGFQLSFASVIAIIYLYPKIKSFLRLEVVKIKVLRFVIEASLVSFSAWVGTMGFIAYYFKIFSPVTVLANIIIVPLATLITLCGFSLILIGLLFLPLVPFFASTCESIVALLIKINAFLVNLPAAYFYLP